MLRVAPGGAVQTHTGCSTRVVSTWPDEHGRLYAFTAAGHRLVHTQDVLHAADAIEAGIWPQPARLALAALPKRFDHVTRPAAAHAGSTTDSDSIP